MRKINLIWSVSLMLIGISTFILVGSNVIGIRLPNILIRILGIIDLIALPFLSYSTIKKISKKGM